MGIFPNMIFFSFYTNRAAFMYIWLLLYLTVLNANVCFPYKYIHVCCIFIHGVLSLSVRVLVCLHFHLQFNAFGNVYHTQFNAGRIVFNLCDRQAKWGQTFALSIAQSENISTLSGGAAGGRFERSVGVLLIQGTIILLIIKTQKRKVNN